MKKTLLIKTIVYSSILLMGLVLSGTKLEARYVYPADSSTIEIVTNTANQSFDEAIMIGLQALDQIDNFSFQFGIIKVEMVDCCIFAKVKYSDLKKASKMSAGLFVRKFVKFSTKNEK